MQTRIYKNFLVMSIRGLAPFLTSCALRTAGPLLKQHSTAGPGGEGEREPDLRVCALTLSCAVWES